MAGYGAIPPGSKCALPFSSLPMPPGCQLSAVAEKRSRGSGQCVTRQSGLPELFELVGQGHLVGGTDSL